MSDFDIGRLDGFTSFLAGVKTYNRVGDADSTPLAGRWSLAADGALILYHSARAINDVRSGYNTDRWDDFAGKVYTLALSARQAYRKPALKATALNALAGNVSIGQLVMGETTFKVAQLPDPVLSAFGVKVVKSEQASVKEWMQEQVRKHEEYRLYVRDHLAQRATQKTAPRPAFTVSGTRMLCTPVYGR